MPFDVLPSTPAISSLTPSSGAAGTAVTISGTSFVDVISVQFNGITAAYTVNSATQITATVPAGETSGPLTITTAGGTASTSFGTGSGGGLPLFVVHNISGEEIAGLLINDQDEIIVQG